MIYMIEKLKLLLGKKEIEKEQENEVTPKS